MYNDILNMQQNKLGKDHLDCGGNLDDIDVVFMRTG